jgi:Leucine-rich repeat (LRR) protein
MHLQKLRYVVTLNLSRNIVKDGRFLSNGGIFPYLKTLNLSFNKLKLLPSLNLRNIAHLNLNGN